MSLDQRLQALLGGESAEITTVIADPLVQAEQVQDTAIAVAEADINAIETEIVEQSNDIEVLEDRVEELEAQIEGVESMLRGDRPWNPELAQHFYDSARKVVARTMGEGAAVSVKGAESFADLDNAKLELHSGLEDMKGKATALWGNVKQFFINLYNTIINFFKGIFNRFRGIEGKAQSLATRVNAAADDKLKKEITLGGWNAFVDAEKTKGKDSAASRASIDAVSTLGHGLKGNYDGMVETARKAFNGMASAGDSKKAEGTNENTETIKFKEGGIEFTVTMPASSPKDKAAALSGTKISYKVNKDGVKTSGTYASGAGKSDLSGIVSSVLKAAKDAQVGAFKESELKTARDKAIAEIEVAARGTDADKGETNKKVAVVRNAHNAALRAASVISRYTGDLLNAQLSYVGAHL